MNWSCLMATNDLGIFHSRREVTDRNSEVAQEQLKVWPQKWPEKQILDKSNFYSAKSFINQGTYSKLCYFSYTNIQYSISFRYTEQWCNIFTHYEKITVNKINYHPAPYEVVTILLIIFPICHFFMHNLLFVYF